MGIVYDKREKREIMLKEKNLAATATRSKQINKETKLSINENEQNLQKLFVKLK